jgi:ABC-type phosphonate transport system ATPase subunit
MDNVYGITYNGIHTDTSNTERGAKCYATRNGFTTVSVRFNCGYVVAIIAERVNGKWQAIEE